MNKEGRNILPRTCSEGTEGGVEKWLYCFLNLGARWGDQSTPCPSHFTTRKEPQYPLYRRLAGPQGWSG